MDGPVVPRKENAGYHKNTLGVPLPSERKDLEWVGRLGQVIKSVIRDLCLGFTACSSWEPRVLVLGLTWPGLDSHAGLYVLLPPAGSSRTRLKIWFGTGASRACGLSLTLRTPDFVDEK